MQQIDIASFRIALLTWFQQHARDLPWRRTRNPYLIWISEIMLQQTRVAAVLDHYARFTARFPDIQSLAQAPEDDVLALWSGLGYYRRARMLHRAAKSIVETRHGVFPSTYADLLTLPGIGNYTAAAVASIAFAEPVAVVDGNVERVLTRLAALDRQSSPTPLPRRIRNLADTLVDPAEPSHFNQAMMELGATICLPRAPLCLHCPVRESCTTRGEHLATPRKALVARDAFYSLLERTSEQQDRLILLEQRPPDASLMAGMWQLPEITGPDPAPPMYTVKHSITVTNYTVRVYRDLGPFRHTWNRQWIHAADIEALPLTGLTRKILRLRNIDLHTRAPRFVKKK